MHDEGFELRVSTVYHLIMSLITELSGYGISALWLKYIVWFLKRKGTCQIKQNQSAVISALHRLGFMVFLYRVHLQSDGGPIVAQWPEEQVLQPSRR